MIIGVFDETLDIGLHENGRFPLQQPEVGLKRLILPFVPFFKLDDFLLVLNGRLLLIFVYLSLGQLVSLVELLPLYLRVIKLVPERNDFDGFFPLYRQLSMYITLNHAARFGHHSGGR